MALIFLILALNVVIATWNARMVGRAWDLANGFLVKFLLFSGLVQSVVGYSSAIVLFVGVGAYYKGMIDDEMLNQTMQLWYLLVIFPCIGTGLIIWLHSVMSALRQPGGGNFLAAGWNSYAMYHNISGAVQHVPEASKGVGKLFDSLFKSKGDARGKLVILLVVVSFGLSILLTWSVFASGRKATAAELAVA